MRWADQLIKLAKFELEVLQTRLAQIVERRNLAEMKLAVLAAEGEAETMLARANPEAAWRLPAFLEGLKARKARAQADIDLVAAEAQVDPAQGVKAGGFVVFGAQPLDLLRQLRRRRRGEGRWLPGERGRAEEQTHR